MKLQLIKKTKDELKELAKVYGVKGISKLNKDALCDEIMPVILDSATTWLALFDDAQLEIIKELVANGQVQIDANLAGYYKFLENIGFITLSKDGKIVLPEEIRDQYKNCDEKLKEVEEMHLQYKKWHQYVLAATHLYGAVTLEHLYSLYEKYEGQKIDENAFMEWLGKESYLMRTYTHLEEYLVSDCLYYFEQKGFKELKIATEGKPYYVPSRRDEFLCYSDENYFESNLHIEKLKTHLRKTYALNDQTVQDAIFELYLGQQISTSDESKTIQQTLGEWNLMGIAPRDLKEVNEIVSLVVNVMNSTRMWINRGYKPEELRQQDHMQPVSKNKVGRNEACPCGSGKKYKKCCGR